MRYEKPPEPPRGDEMDLDDDDDEGADYNYVPPPLGGGSGGGPPAEEPIPNAPRSKLPGQSKFAERLMTKYGWTKGSGLGADESGITSALRVQVEKRRKRADAEGGGWAEPGGRGKILGGKTRKKTDGAAEEDGIGPMSQVIVLRGMLDGMADLQAEIEDGLGQEIGEECGEKYGRVERLYIDVQGEDDGRGVFIKFTDQVSALRVSFLFLLSPLPSTERVSPLGLLRALTCHKGRQRPAGPYIQREPHRGQVLRPRKVRERRLQVKKVVYDQHQGKRAPGNQATRRGQASYYPRALSVRDSLRYPKYKMQPGTLI